MSYRVSAEVQEEESEYSNSQYTSTEEPHLPQRTFNMEDVAMYIPKEKMPITAGDSVCYVHKVMLS